MPHNRFYQRILAATMALSLGLGATTAGAIDGTAGSTPMPVESCAIHPATPLRAATANMGATPVVAATELATIVASPIATPGASPIASPMAEMSPTPDAIPVEDDLTAAVSSILTCMSENNVDVLTQITSPDFRGTWLGVGIPLEDEEFASVLPMMPRLPYALVEMTRIDSDGPTANITVVYTVGKQVMTADWVLGRADAGGTQVWRVQASAARPTEIPTSAPTLDVVIQDGSFRFTPDRAAGTELVLNVTNSGQNVHEILILRTPSTMTVAEIVASPTGVPEGTTFIAQATVPPGESGTIVLSGLRPGTYTVVDLLQDASGMPNATSGMFSTFKVTE
ncbi:MAG: cupredoxin domain-containing protein [Thermomicrobiales bacterium]|nr:cupredoxin domain-containing protein [Thermomicrobiales bacterium]MCO5226152.1 cupredoxin domain-containing protein [Thermomicrobiales bacterium]